MKPPIPSPPGPGRHPGGVRFLPVALLATALCLAAIQASAQNSAPAREGDAGEEPAAVAAADLDVLEARLTKSPNDLRAGADYRKACIAAQAYDRCIETFERLAEANPDSHAIRLNWGYALVDKIPAAGAVTQVILADNALSRFTAALEVEETWLGLYTRGNSYIHWPPIFGRTKLGIADLEKAIARSEALGDGAPAYHANAYAALGDGHWRLDDLEEARRVWRTGLERFPGDGKLERRLELEDDDALAEYLKEEYAIGNRVDTSLDALWSEG